jgi:uncharacterized protein (DUF2132 family)
MIKYELSPKELLKAFKKLKGSSPLNHAYFSKEGKEKTGTACIDCENWEIEINPKFAHELIAKGLDEQTIYEGLLAHEIGHYRHHPFDLETSLLEVDALEKNNMPLGIKGLYDDFMCNSRIILEKKEESLSKIYKTLESESILQTLNGFYSYLSNGYGSNCLFSGKKPANDEIEKISRLKEINIRCKKNIHPYFIKKFYEIFKDEKIPNESLEQIMQGLKDKYGEKKLKETIKKLAEEKKISADSAKKYFSKSEIKEEYFSSFQRHINESKKYSIRVQSIKKTGSRFNSPYCPRKTSIDDISNYDPFISIASGGRAMPGLSNSWISKESGFLEEFSTLNDLILMVDSSGSMIDPNNDEILSFAIVSAMTVANYYMMNNKKVAVVNFSSNTLVNDFSDNRKKVLESIFTYQGGGTHLDIKEIKLNFDSKDTLIITDEQIENYSETIKFLKSKKNEQGHTYIISIGNEDSKAEEEGIKRIKITDPKDIPKIVIGE